MNRISLFKRQKKDKKGCKMGKNIFCALFVIGLCFGQSIWLKENPRINLPMPINGAIRSVAGTNECTMRKFSLYSSQTFSLINPLNPNNLIMQVEGESLQPKASCWKQAGIYGLEFVGAEIIVLPASLIPFEVLSKDYNWGYLPIMLLVYFGGNIIGSSSAVWATGRLLNQKGTWWKSAAGGGIGTLIGLSITYSLGGTKFDYEHPWICSTVWYISPALGAVVEYNF
ncbi:MAG: hypothetical protein ACUVQ4_06490 [bacterium]